MTTSYPQCMDSETEPSILHTISPNIEPSLASYLQDTPGFLDPFSIPSMEDKKCPMEDNGPTRAELNERIMYIKHALLVMGNPGIGELFSTDLCEIKKTVDCIYTLVRQCQIGLDQKRKHSELTQKYKNELSSAQKKLELAVRDKEKLQRELGKMENSISTMREKARRSATGEKSNKEDFKQTMFKMEQKIAQVVHEMRKKETTLGKVQEQYRKATKENLPYRNGIDMCSRLEAEGLGIFKEKALAGTDMCYMLKTGYEECQKRLVEENSRLKECLELTHKEIVGMLNKVVETLKQMWSEGKIDNGIKCIEPIQLKPIVFQMPLKGLINDIYQIFRENICRMKDCLDAILSNF